MWCMLNSSRCVNVMLLRSTIKTPALQRPFCLAEQIEETKVWLNTPPFSLKMSL
jgi:hypothetical protein